MKKFLEQWKWVLVGMIGVVLLGFFLRVYNLTILPIFVDEAIYIRWAQVMASEATLRFLPLSDGKQPLFMWVLMFLIDYFSDPLFIGRLVSVASSVGTMFGIFIFSYLLFKNKAVSLFSVFAYSISPFSVFSLRSITDQQPIRQPEALQSFYVYAESMQVSTIFCTAPILT